MGGAGSKPTALGEHQSARNPCMWCDWARHHYREYRAPGDVVCEPPPKCVMRYLGRESVNWKPRNSGDPGVDMHRVYFQEGVGGYNLCFNGKLNPSNTRVVVSKSDKDTDCDVLVAPLPVENYVTKECQLTLRPIYEDDVFGLHYFRTIRFHDFGYYKEFQLHRLMPPFGDDYSQVKGLWWSSLSQWQLTLTYPASTIIEKAVLEADYPIIFWHMQHRYKHTLPELEQILSRDVAVWIVMRYLGLEPKWFG